jgi:enoyl-CoA hydratase/carnithine racemase
VLTGERLPAADALAYGLVNQVVPLEALAAAADTGAERICAASPLAVQAAKYAAYRGLAGSLETALSTKYEPIEQYAVSDAVSEGRRPFADKRAPRWTGR